MFLVGDAFSWSLCPHLRHARSIVSSVLLAGLGLWTFGAAHAAEGTIVIELNKLEIHNKDCRAYFVVENKEDAPFEALKLDLVLFDTEGVIDERFALDLAPLKANKRTVKLFDVTDTACDKVGSLHINDVVECTSDAGAVSDCLEDISVSSRAKKDLTK